MHSSWVLWRTTTTGVCGGGRDVVFAVAFTGAHTGLGAKGQVHCVYVGGGVVLAYCLTDRQCNQARP